MNATIDHEEGERVGMYQKMYRRSAAMGLSVILAGSTLLTACGDSKKEGGKQTEPSAAASTAAGQSAKPAGPKPKISVSI